MKLRLTKKYLSVLDDVVEELPSGDVFHHHEDVRGGGDHLFLKKIFLYNPCVNLCVLYLPGTA